MSAEKQKGLSVVSKMDVALVRGGEVFSGTVLKTAVSNSDWLLSAVADLEMGDNPGSVVAQLLNRAIVPEITSGVELEWPESVFNQYGVSQALERLVEHFPAVSKEISTKTMPISSALHEFVDRAGRQEFAGAEVYAGAYKMLSEMIDLVSNGKCRFEKREIGTDTYFEEVALEGQNTLLNPEQRKKLEAELSSVLAVCKERRNPIREATRERQALRVELVAAQLICGFLGESTGGNQNEKTSAVELWTKIRDEKAIALQKAGEALPARMEKVLAELERQSFSIYGELQTASERQDKTGGTSIGRPNG